MYSLFTANSGIHRLTWGLVFELGCRKEASVQTDTLFLFVPSSQGPEKGVL